MHEAPTKKPSWESNSEDYLLVTFHKKKQIGMSKKENTFLYHCEPQH